MKLTPISNPVPVVNTAARTGLSSDLVRDQSPEGKKE